MSRRDCSSRRGGPPRGGGGGGARETPQLISGLAAWYDLRDPAYVTIATGVSALVSRAGSLGAEPLSQGTAANQPSYATAVATLGNKNALLFDGTNDSLFAGTAADWTFLHNGSGASIFMVRRIDSTGGATMRTLSTSEGTAETGLLFQYTTTAARTIICNGSGTAANDNNSSTAALFARDVSAWTVLDYNTNSNDIYVSGASATTTDTASPSASSPTRALRVGATSAGGSPFKGWIAQIIVYSKILSAAERTALATWANQQYGVSV